MEHIARDRCYASVEVVFELEELAKIFSSMVFKKKKLFCFPHTWGKELRVKVNEITLIIDTDMIVEAIIFDKEK